MDEPINNQHQNPNANAEEYIKLSHLIVGKFKSIVEPITLEIAPLTVLCGANSSGKSAFMQPFLMLKQTLNNPIPQGDLHLRGANVNFISVKDFQSDSEPTVLDFGFSFTNQFFQKYKFIEDNYFLRVSEHTNPISNNSGDDFPEGYQNQKNVKDRLYDFYLRGGDLVTQHSLLSDVFFSYYDSLKLGIDQLLHLQGLRQSAQRSFPIRDVNKISYPGYFDEYVPSILNSWDKKEHTNKKELLFIYLKRLSIAEEVKTEVNSLQQIEVSVKVNASGRVTNIADVGLGVSQALPILVAIIEAEKDQFIYIEQPETHLHPNAQYVLGEILAEAAQEGKRIILETHSSILLTSFQTQVAKGNLDPEKAVFHWFSLDEKAHTTVSSVKPDQNGALESWPSDFDEVYLNADVQYLNAVRENRKK